MARFRLPAAFLLALGFPAVTPAADLDDWAKATAALKANDQVEAFRTKMKELNRTLEVAAIAVEVKNGVVVEVTIPAAYAEDIRPLAVFRDLEKLAVYGHARHVSKVADVSALKGLTRLREVNLAATSVADLSPLAALPIEKLYLNGTPVKNLRALKNMPVTDLELPAGVEAKELEVLKDKPLTWFSNYGKGPDQMQFERLFTNAKLETFRVSTHGITSLEPLRGMPLKVVILGDTPGLKDTAKQKALDPLTGCEKLRFLSVGKADIADLSPVAGKPLDHLTIADAPRLRDLTPLKDAKALSFLSLYRTGVNDLTPVADLGNLTTLYLGELQLKSLKPLAGLRKLKSLDLRKTAVGDRDYTPLTKLTPTHLWIDLNPTTGPVVQKIPTLETLNGKPLKQ